MGRFGAVLLFSIILGLGAGFYGRLTSLQRCREAASLRQVAPNLVAWIQAAQGDAFEQALLRQEPILRLIVEAQARALDSAKGFPNWYLSQSAKAGLQNFAVANLDRIPEFIYALQAAAHVELSSRCLAEEDPELKTMLARGQAYWDGRRSEVRLAKMSFARDKEIFCRARSLLEKLEKLKAATELQCQERSTKKNRACRPTAMESVNKEIADLTNQKEFNYEKLRRKWPGGILGDIPCL